MKCLMALIACFLSLIAVSEAAPLESASKYVYGQGMAAAGRADYAQAILLFEKAKTLFANEKNQEGAYKSAALAAHLAVEDAFLRQSKPPANGYRAGWTLADPLYSAHFVKPDVGAFPFAGLLILGKEIRRVPTPGGGSVPVNAVLDAQAVPALQPGEQFAPDPGPCQMGVDGPPEGELAAVVKTKGHENEGFWKNVRKAWRLNPRSGRIEEVPAAQVVCRNETLGI